MADRNNNNRNPNVEVRAQYLRVMLEHVRQDVYPSTTQMDIIEQSLPPQWIPDYLDILIEKVADEPYPSNSMLRRIGRLVEMVPRSA